MIPDKNITKNEIKIEAQRTIDDCDLILALEPNPTLTRVSVIENRQSVQALALHIKRLARLYRDYSFNMYKK